MIDCSTCTDHTFFFFHISVSPTLASREVFHRKLHSSSFHRPQSSGVRNPFPAKSHQPSQQSISWRRDRASRQSWWATRFFFGGSKHTLCSFCVVIRILRKRTPCRRGRDSPTTLQRRRQRVGVFNSHVPVEAGVESGTVLKAPLGAGKLAPVTTFHNTHKKSKSSLNASPCA